MFDGGQQFVLGIVGGFAVELLKWYRLRDEMHKGVPDWSRSWLYWVLTIGMMIMGGVVTYIYYLSGTELSPILAVNIGASAPALIAAGFGNAKIPPGKVG